MRSHPFACLVSHIDIKLSTGWSCHCSNKHKTVCVERVFSWNEKGVFKEERV